MAFFDDLSKKISSCADKAADKAKDLAEIGKLSLNISAAEKELQSLYAEIGQAVYKKELTNPESPFQNTFTKITVVLEKLADLNSQLSAVKAGDDSVINIEPKEDESVAPTDQTTTEEICPICGAMMALESKYCPACGAQL